MFTLGWQDPTYTSSLTGVGHTIEEAKQGLLVAARRQIATLDRMNEENTGKQNIFLALEGILTRK